MPFPFSQREADSTIAKELVKDLRHTLPYLSIVESKEPGMSSCR